MVALDGWYDHAHLLAAVSVNHAIAYLVKQMKGVSSHFFNDVLKPSVHFQWQPNYGAFTVSPWEVDVVKAYIENQKRHHAENTIIPAYEESGMELFRDMP